MAPEHRSALSPKPSLLLAEGQPASRCSRPCSPGTATFRNAPFPCLALGLVWLMCFTEELVKGFEVHDLRSESNFKSTDKKQENEENCITLEMTMCEQVSV